MARKVSVLACLANLIIISAAVSGHFQEVKNATARQDSGGWPYQQFNLSQAQVHPKPQIVRQAAIANPLVAFFPSILLAGLGLVGLVPLSLMYLNSAGGFSGLLGTSRFGRKRRSTPGYPLGHRGAFGSRESEGRLGDLVTSAIDRQTREYQIMSPPYKTRNQEQK